jgi:predicted ferric reductase
MWGLLATVLLVVFRRRLPLQPHTWRMSHRTLAAVIVTGSVVHAMMIEGTMEMLSKSVLCALVLIATAMVLADLWFRK